MKTFNDFLSQHITDGKDWLELRSIYQNETVYEYKDVYYDDVDDVDEAIREELGKNVKYVSDEMVADEWDYVDEIKRKELVEWI